MTWIFRSVPIIVKTIDPPTSAGTPNVASESGVCFCCVYFYPEFSVVPWKGNQEKPSLESILGLPNTLKAILINVRKMM